MNPTLDLLMNRKSIRNFSSQPVTAEEKAAVLNAAMRAPTAGNMQLYSILEVEDQALKDRLAVTCDDQPFIARSPWVLLFLADYQRWYDGFRAFGVEEQCRAQSREMRLPAEGDLMLAFCDALIAAQTAVVAAEALGLGSCYIGDIVEHYEDHRRLFSLPQYAVPAALICFGHPTPEQAARKLTSRFDPEFILHRDSYTHLDPPVLERMFHDRTAQLLKNPSRPEGIENALQFNYVKKFSAEFTEEMTRSVRALLASWCASGK